ncbi:MAG: histidine phosphatase family protein [Sulfurimonas sp.]|nr:histidine phosphatase family protein [Sulfurimonas sp.]
MKFTMIRHASTAYGLSGLYMGKLDIPATQEGLNQASELGLSLQGIRFTDHVSSPLLRARMTAEKVFPNRSIKIDDRLRERDLGMWAGYSKKEIRDKYPEAFLPSGFIDPYYTPENGEPIKNMISRVKKFVIDIEKMNENDHVVAITHNGVIRVIRCLIENHPFQDIFSEAEPHLTPHSYQYSDNTWSTISLNYIFDEF